jgi:hypothetical protein
MIHLPTAVELKVCQDYIIQEKTRNITLVNCASKFPGKSFPVVLPAFTVSAKLTDAFGKIELSLVIYHLGTLEEIYSKTVEAEFRDRLAEMWFFLRVRDCEFSEPGRWPIVRFCSLRRRIIHD